MGKLGEAATRFVNQIRSLYDKHKYWILPLSAVITFFHAVYWSYVLSFGSVLFQIADISFYSGFMLKLFATVVVASVLSSLIYLLISLAILVLPFRLLRFRKYRKAEKFVKSSILFRIVILASTFAFLFVGWKNAVIWCALVGINLIIGIFYKPRPDITYNEIRHKLDELMLRHKQLETSSVGSNLHLNKGKNDESDWPRLVEDFLFLKQENNLAARKLYREQRILNRRLEIMQGTFVGAILTVSVLVGWGHADVQKNGKLFNVVSGNSYTVALIGQTRDFLITFDRETKNTYALPVSDTKILP